MQVICIFAVLTVNWRPRSV